MFERIHFQVCGRRNRPFGLNQGRRIKRGKRLPPALQSRGQNPVLKRFLQRRCDKFKTPQSGSRQHLESLDLPVFLEFDKRALFTPVPTRNVRKYGNIRSSTEFVTGRILRLFRSHRFGRKDSQAGFIGKDCESFLERTGLNDPHGKNAAQGKTRGQGHPEEGFRPSAVSPRNLPGFGFGQSNDPVFHEGKFATAGFSLYLDRAVQEVPQLGVRSLYLFGDFSCRRLFPTGTKKQAKKNDDG